MKGKRSSWRLSAMFRVLGDRRSQARRRTVFYALGPPAASILAVTFGGGVVRLLQPTVLVGFAPWQSCTVVLPKGAWGSCPRRATIRGIDDCGRQERTRARRPRDRRARCGISSSIPLTSIRERSDGSATLFGTPREAARRSCRLRPQPRPHGVGSVWELLARAAMAARAARCSDATWRHPTLGARHAPSGVRAADFQH